jgi:hypothetical protein
MDPITAIVTALALGAASGLKDTAAKVIVDAYSALKAVIQNKYNKVNLSQLEQNPKSKARQEVVAEDLASTAISGDADVLEKAKQLLDLIKTHAPGDAAAIGVDLKDLEAASLRIADVIATGAGVRLEHGKIAGPVEITGVRAGTGGEQGPKKN